MKNTVENSYTCYSKVLLSTVKHRNGFEAFKFGRLRVCVLSSTHRPLGKLLKHTWRNFEQSKSKPDLANWGILQGRLPRNFEGILAKSKQARENKYRGWRNLRLKTMHIRDCKTKNTLTYEDRQKDYWALSSPYFMSDSEIKWMKGIIKTTSQSDQQDI